MQESTLNPALARWLWSEQLARLPAWKRRFVSVLRYAYVVIDDLAQGQLTMRAMSLVYTSLLSLVPLMAVSFSVLKAFGVHNKQLEPLMLQFLAPMGEQGVQITDQVIGFIENVKIGVLGTVGIVLLFYTAISLIQKIESSFNYVWRLQHSRTMGRRFTDYGSVMLIGPLLVFTAIGISAKVLGGAYVQQASQFEVVAWLVGVVTRAMPYLMIIAAFSFFYIFIPNTKVKLRAGIIAGVVSGFLWQSIGWGFGKIIVSATGSSTYAIYSGFAILILFMMWMYISWLILLIGGSIAFYVQHPEYVVPTRREGGMSNIQKERLALQIMLVIARRHYQGKKPVNANTLVQRLRVQIQAIMQVLNALKEARLIVENNADPSGYLPNVPLEETNIKQVLDAARSADEMPRIFHHRPQPVPGVKELEKTVDSALETVLGGLTIKQLALSDFDEELPPPVKDEES